ncbi:MAG TPA: acyl-CoA thioesterase [Nocardioides sp.]|nr:acyl-CoA thioesterase [Nocardioides sp.]
MRHRTSCPLRWADLDLLGHVNNVRYADYLRAGRDDLLGTAGIDVGPAGLPVRRHELTFVAPLMFGRQPVVVESSLAELGDTGATLQHVLLGPGPEPVVHLRARTEVAWRSGGLSTAQRAALAPYVEPAAPHPAPEPVRVRADMQSHYPLVVRAGDLDATGSASDVALVEFFQEARIGFFDRLRRAGLERGTLRWVVAQTDIDHLRPVAGRAPAYDCYTRLARLGRRSLTVESVIQDQDGLDLAAARVVLVVFDPVANRSVDPPPGYREVLETFVAPA